MIVVTKMMTFLSNYAAGSGFGSDPPIDEDLDSVLVPNPQNRSAPAFRLLSNPKSDSEWIRMEWIRIPASKFLNLGRFSI